MKLALIDIDSLLFYSGYGRSTMPDVMEEVNKRLMNIQIDTRYDHHILFTGFSSFRRSIDAQYKGNRKMTQLQKFVGVIKKYMVDNHNVHYVEGLEADDLVGIHYEYYKKDYDIIICSPDCDFKTLPGSIYDYKSTKSYYIYDNEAEYNYWKYVCIGQVKDNIKPVFRGFGEAKFEKYWKYIKNEKLSPFSAIYSLFLYGVDKGIVGKEFKPIEAKIDRKKKFIINNRMMKILRTERDCKKMKVPYKIFEYDTPKW